MRGHTHGRVLVVIPAFNEVATIEQVVLRTRRAAPAADILVVDDGSSDATGTAAAAAGARVARLPFNLGVGAAIRTGYRHAHRHGYDAVVQIDADGQHDPDDIGALLDGLADHDLVIGSRFGGGQRYEVGLVRRAAMEVLSSGMSRLLHTRLDDTTSGFRAVSRRGVAVFAQHYPAEYLNDTLETLVIARQVGLKVTQVRVNMHARQGGRPSRRTLAAARDLVSATATVLFGLCRDWSVQPEVAP